MDLSNLKESHVVITGGSSGMGLATAQAATAAGARVTLIARKQPALERAVGELGAAAQFRCLDVADVDAVARCFEQLGEIDHLVTAAAGNVVGDVATLDIGLAREFFDGKFWGQYACARAAAPRIRPGGSITLFSGAGSRRVFPGFVLVGTAEAAIEQLTKYLAREFAPLRVNAVVPGVIETPLTAALPQWDQVREQTAAALPVQRVGQADDVAAAVIMLMRNTFMSGSIVDVDGGHSVI